MKILAYFTLFLLFSVSAQAQICARVSIDGAGPQKLARAKTLPGLQWWVEMGDTLLVYGDQKCLDQMGDLLAIQSVETGVNTDRLAFVSLPLHAGRYRIIARGSRFAVIEELGVSAYEPDMHHHGHFHFGLRMPFKPNTVLTCNLSNRQGQPVRAKKANIEAMLADINPTRWYFDVFDLQCKDRFTFAPGIEDARDFLMESFSKMGLTPMTGLFNLNNVTPENVYAVIEGTERPDEYYVVGAHYDSIANRDSGAFAPGAEDNASGTAAVLEMARVFSAHPPPATIIFICFSGEEQGLFGSEFHVTQLIDQNINDKVRGVLNMDMIGYTAGGFDVLLESSSQFSGLIDTFVQAAATYTTLQVVTSFNPFGSDHVPYLQADIPALLVIEDDWNRYPGYHKTIDTIDLIGTRMGHEVLRMNVAALAEMMENP